MWRMNRIHVLCFDAAKKLKRSGNQKKKTAKKFGRLCRLFMSNAVGVVKKSTFVRKSLSRQSK